MLNNVGIPRALLYYKYYPMWHAFLKRLGAEITVSDATRQQTVMKGSSRVVTDTCLPVKVFIGHVVSLVDKSDCILIPVVRSTRRKVFNCSRFLGLPDVTRAVVPESPPILEIEFDMNRGKGFLYRQIYDLGRHFTDNPFRIREAAIHAWEAHCAYRDLSIRQHLNRPEAIEALLDGHKPPTVKDDRDKITIGLLGHPYLLHDEYISHRLIGRLRAFGFNVLLPEMVPPRLAGESLADDVGLADSYWESEEDVLDAAAYYLGNGVDGIIGAMAFSCGPDSMMMHLAQQQSRQANVPFMCLTMEEHTAEAGIITRLEAFLDMLQRRRNRERSCV